MTPTIAIPQLDLQREYAFFKKDINAAIVSCARSQRWILGEHVKAFEEALARYLGVRHAVGVASGTDALLIALRAAAMLTKNREGFFEKRDEVITTAFTFLATGETIIRAGATPVFVDIEPDTFTISPKAIQRAITKNTRAIIPVHLYGRPCDMSAIMNIARTHTLNVIEDAAQACGATYRGSFVGSLGTMGAFSFFPSKNLGGWGDGGMLTTNDDKIAHFARCLRNHGQRAHYDASYLGYNSRLDSLQAAVLHAKLPHLSELTRRRVTIAHAYSAALADIKKISLPVTPKPVGHAYNLYVMRVPDSLRNALLQHLCSRGVESRVYYPLALNTMAAFKEARLSGTLEHTKAACQSVLTLPLHPFLKKSEIAFVVKTVRSFFKKV
ncbi:MAG: DegT/DnrJ/EryC1/StrS family aminotransferase [Candidatus Omnitrophota bacterium]